MSDRQFNEKEEKEEKERSKHDEKTAEEKWRRDPLGSIVWALILIWAGLVLLANNLGLLGWLPFTQAEDFGIISLILIGAGSILLLEVAIRLLVPDYRQPVVGTLILALILIGIGLGDLISWDLIWPVILIARGLYFLLRGTFRRR